MFTFEWGHAWAGRLADVSEKTAEAHVVAASTRLSAECAIGHLPVMQMPFANDLRQQLDALTPRFAAFKHMLVLGIGGSALGARALQKAFYPQQDRPNHNGRSLWIADNVDADSLNAYMASLNPEETIVVAISKSGGTIETLAQYFLIKEWLKKSLNERWNQHMLLITDEKVGYLREEADTENITSLPVPDNLGGRYSIFSAVGMVPAAFLEMDWKALLDGVHAVTAPLATATPNQLLAHPSWKMAVWAWELWKKEYSQLIFFSYIPAWAHLGAWFGQLWAESLGKNGRGTMPLPAVGATDQHSLQQMFLDGPADKGCLLLSCPSAAMGDAGPLFPDTVPDTWSWLRGRPFGDLLDAECLGSAAAMARANMPLLQLMPENTSERAAGSVMGLCMAATVLTGWLMDIDPLDQPAVELGKRLAYSRLGAPGYNEEAAMLKAFLKKCS